MALHSLQRKKVFVVLTRKKIGNFITISDRFIRGAYSIIKSCQLELLHFAIKALLHLRKNSIAFCAKKLYYILRKQVLSHSEPI